MSNRPSLQKTIQKDVANNNNANVQPASMEDDTLNKCSSPLIIDYDSSRPSWLTNSESLRSRGREILAPIKRSGSTVNNVYSEGSDENTPPPEGSVSSRTSSVENTPQKHILPPLNTSPSLAHSGQGKTYWDSKSPLFFRSFLKRKEKKECPYLYRVFFKVQSNLFSLQKSINFLDKTNLGQCKLKCQENLWI